MVDTNGHSEMRELCMIVSRSYVCNLKSFSVTKDIRIATEERDKDDGLHMSIRGVDLFFLSLGIIHVQSKAFRRLKFLCFQFFHQFLHDIQDDEIRSFASNGLKAHRQAEGL